MLVHLLICYNNSTRRKLREDAHLTESPRKSCFVMGLAGCNYESVNHCFSSSVFLTTDQLSQDKAVWERWLPGPCVWTHRGLLLHPWSFPSQRNLLHARARRLLGPLWDAQLPRPPVPAQAWRLQALPWLGRHGCQGRLSETGHGFVLSFILLVTTHLCNKYTTCVPGTKWLLLIFNI